VALFAEPIVPIISHAVVVFLAVQLDVDSTMGTVEHVINLPERIILFAKLVALFAEPIVPIFSRTFVVFLAVSHDVDSTMGTVENVINLHAVIIRTITTAFVAMFPCLNLTVSTQRCDRHFVKQVLVKQVIECL
jgi:hypothetical protein